MEIKIGDYKVQSDSMNLWVTKDSVGRNGTHTEKKVAGYAQNFEQLYTQFIEEREELLSLWPEILDKSVEYGKAKEKKKRVSKGGK